VKQKFFEKYRQVFTFEYIARFFLLIILIYLIDNFTTISVLENKLSFPWTTPGVLQLIPGIEKPTITSYFVVYTCCVLFTLLAILNLKFTILLFFSYFLFRAYLIGFKMAPGNNYFYHSYILGIWSLFAVSIYSLFKDKYKHASLVSLFF
jgi:hypothetical protein